MQPNGSKWWRFRYRFYGKPCLRSLGTYPKTTLKEARLERDRLQTLIKPGVNPSMQRQEAKFMAAKSMANSFESVARIISKFSHSKAIFSFCPVFYTLAVKGSVLTVVSDRPKRSFLFEK